MLFQMALAAPGTVNAARLAFGSSGGFGSTGPNRSARACAISLVWREAQMPEQLMQPRPLLRNTLSAIMSRYFSHWSTTSSPSKILLKPGPCT